MKILLCGKMGAGKDTAAQYLAQKRAFIKFAYAAGIKETANLLFPKMVQEHKKPRELYQRLGDGMRAIDKMVWINYTFNQIRFYGNGLNMTITDGRRLNEVISAQAEGFVPVLVQAPRDLRIFRLVMRDGDLDEATLDHPSETELDNMDFKFEHVLNNSRAKKFLFEQVDELIKELGGVGDDQGYTCPCK